MQQTVGDYGVPTRCDDGKTHPRGGEIALNCGRFSVQWVFRLPKAEQQFVRSSFRQSHCKQPAVPVGLFRLAQQRLDFFGAIVCQHPLLDSRINRVQSHDLDQDGWNGRRTACNEFEVS